MQQQVQNKVFVLHEVKHPCTQDNNPFIALGYIPSQLKLYKNKNPCIE